MIQGVMHYMSDRLYYAVWGYQLNATPENLKWALQQNKQDIPKYTLGPYSIMEYAVIRGDLEAARVIVDAGAYLGERTLDTGSIIHFYVECLADDRIIYDRVLFTYLTEHIPYWQMFSSKLRRPLEHALKKIIEGKNISWDVIAILLKKEASVTQLASDCSISYTYFTANYIRKLLNDNDAHYEKGLILLEALTTYVELEASHFPGYSRRMQYSQLCDCVSHAKTAFTKAFEEETCCPISFISGAVLALAKTATWDVNSPLFPLKANAAGLTSHHDEIAFNESYRMGHAFFLYAHYFKQFCTGENTFIDCLGTDFWQKNIIPAIENYPHAEEKQLVLDSCKLLMLL